MIDLIRAESIKAFRRRVFWVMIVILVGLTVLTAVLLIYLPTIAPAEFEGFPGIAKPDAYTFGVTQVIGQTWFPAILAVMLLGGELSTSVWAAALTMESRRWMHVLAKVVVITTAAWLAALVAVAGWSLVTLVLAEGSGGPGPAEWSGIALKILLIQFTWVSLAMGATGLFRAIGPAIGVVLAFSFGESILALWRPWQQVSLSGSSSRLVGQSQFGMGISFLSDVSFAQALAVVAGWAMVGVALAVWGLQIRDP